MQFQLSDPFPHWFQIHSPCQTVVIKASHGFPTKYRVMWQGRVDKQYQDLLLPSTARTVAEPRLHTSESHQPISDTLEPTGLGEDRCKQSLGQSPILPVESRDRQDGSTQATVSAYS